MAPPILAAKYSAGPLSKGSTLELKVSLEPGWHITSNKPSDEFLFGARVEVKAEGVEFGEAQFPEPDMQYIEVLQMENSVFHDTLTILIPVLNVSKNADSLSTILSFHYQACSNLLCLSPAKVSFNFRQPNLFSIQEDSDLQSYKPSQIPEKKKNLAWMLLLAFIGGIILNLMPCVLPVLSIKLMGLIDKAGHTRQEIFKHSSALTLGILVSFWTLALVIISVKTAGEVVGWGFQFQNFYFILFMCFILLIFALNLFGLFEFRLPFSTTQKLHQKAKNHSLSGSFLNGMFMTLLATPCSAPVLGTAISFAFTQSSIVLMLVFTSTGLGLAAPYVMITLSPTLMSWLPKPGEWMNHLRSFMGFALLITLLWLLWVMGRQTNLDALIYTMLALLIISLTLWIWGRFVTMGSSFFLKASILILSAGAIFYVIHNFIIPASKQQSEPAGTMRTISNSGWLDLDIEQLAQLLTQQKTVFLDFTADWCLTCKVNEKAVLESEVVHNQMKYFDVVKIKADWTRKDPTISAMLKDFGCPGVPCYIIYPALEPHKPIRLPELITRDIVLDALYKAGPSQQ
jgi:thiol:disulfide interchange protein